MTATATGKVEMSTVGRLEDGSVLNSATLVGLLPKCDLFLIRGLNPGILPWVRILGKPELLF